MKKIVGFGVLLLMASVIYFKVIDKSRHEHRVQVLPGPPSETPIQKANSLGSLNTMDSSPNSAEQRPEGRPQLNVSDAIDAADLNSQKLQDSSRNPVGPAELKTNEKGELRQNIEKKIIDLRVTFNTIKSIQIRIEKVKMLAVEVSDWRKQNQKFSPEDEKYLDLLNSDFQLLLPSFQNSKSQNEERCKLIRKNLESRIVTDSVRLILNSICPN